MNATDEKHTKYLSETHRAKDHVADPDSEGRII